MARVGVLLLLLLCAVTSFVASQDAGATPITAVQQTPGVLERLMETYVYPLRQYDWAGAFRNLMDSVMTYMAPETKQPKSGHALWDVISILLDKWSDSSSSRLIEEQGRFLLGPLKGYAPDLNDFVTPQLAAHAYDYLGLLWLFTGLTILGALVPLYKYIPEEELLYPEYEFEEESAPAPAPAAMGDTMEDSAEAMMAPGYMNYGVSSDKPPAEEDEAGGQQDYSYYDYKHDGQMPSLQNGQSHDYFNYQYGTQDYDTYGDVKRKDNNGYPPPHRLWQHTVNNRNPRQRATSRR